MTEKKFKVPLPPYNIDYTAIDMQKIAFDYNWNKFIENEFVADILNDIYEHAEAGCYETFFFKDTEKISVIFINEFKDIWKQLGYKISADDVQVVWIRWEREDE